ncbi:MAG: pyridoxamine 5'-phosphate oxidase [Bacteriovoracaceae bacterium]|nr:pyridoxamine 5'-phosphate oxidase [Bacteriovoracaceae bacterium]
MDNNEKFYDLRIDYQQRPLLESEASPNPRLLFSSWFDEALKSGEIEPNGMVFSSISWDKVSAPRPHSRIVLLKETTEEGFIFYTGLLSAKGHQIQSTPVGSLNFWWRKLHRQVRIEGRLSFVSKEKNQHYFGSRPRGSQLAVLTQRQSEKLDSKESLMNKYKSTELRYESQEKLQCPEDWGGICLIPSYFEFWQGQPSRMHDRLCYELQEDKQWNRYRLSP